jgi:release factor glutamine methyltransferase
VKTADRELLLAHVLGKERSWLLAHDDVELSSEQERLFAELLARRAEGEPVAYLAGTAWFCGRPFEVNPAVLVPRPETEQLVEAALAHLRAYASPVVLDVGTGSGAIACTIAAEMPNAVVYATERSPGALAVAKRNALALRVTLSLSKGDLLPSDESVRFDAVVANLPYIPTADIPDALRYEPREALDGGPDGLREYRRLLERLPQRMNAGALILLEAAPPTIAALADLAAAAFPGARMSIGSDYAGLDRYVRIEKAAGGHAVN